LMRSSYPASVRYWVKRFLVERIRREMTHPTGIPEVFIKRLESLGSCFIRVDAGGRPLELAIVE